MNQFEDYYNEGTQDPDKDIESGQWEDLCPNCGGRYLMENIQSAISKSVR